MDDQTNGHAEERDREPRSDGDVGWYLLDDQIGDQLGRDEPGYDPAVAEALHNAHERLIGGGELARLEAYNCIVGFLDAEMSSRQRLAVLFIEALTLADDDPQTPAIPVIDEALELAVELGVERAQDDLLLLRASVNRAILQVPDAAEDLRQCLELISARGEIRELGPAELDTRLEALLHLAGSEFVVGNYDRAEQLLDRAQTLIPRVPTNTTAPLLLAWTRALLLRWRGNYELALTSAMEAADGYAVCGPPATAARIRCVVGEIALDLAERCQHNHQPLASAAFLALAEPYIVRAVELAAPNERDATETMAYITHCRYQLLKGEGEGRIAWLEELARRGAEHQDMALVAQADTQLGREYEALGNIPAAKRWYQRTLAVLNESQMAALGVWAQRALWRLGGETQADAEISVGGRREG